MSKPTKITKEIILEKALEIIINDKNEIVTTYTYTYIEKISKYIAKKEDECYRVVKILWTCREDIPNGQNYLSDAVSWCDSNVPFKFDYINENPEITFNHKELVRKIIADVYIDDAAINPLYL